jgi:hypothetical protein
MSQELEVADPQRLDKAVQEFKPSPAFLAAGSMIPKSYPQVMELAVIMAKSGMVPKEMIGRPEACAVAIMFGLELGLSPTQAIQNIMVVNGRPTIWGDALKALIIGSGKCELFDEDPPHVALKNKKGRCRLVRKKEFGGGEIEMEFSVDDAQRAKLWSKEGPWQTYPGRMLMYRARSWACRDLFPDVLKGMQMREELDDYEIIHPAPSQVRMPERLKTAQEAQIIGSSEPTPEQPPIAQPERSSASTSASEKPEPAGDAQEPGNAPADAAPKAAAKGYEFKGDPTFKITEDRRKELFRMWTQAGIALATVKAHVKEAFGVENTSDLTMGQAEELETWIVKNAK